jgi:hypothetical protein
VSPALLLPVLLAAAAAPEAPAENLLRGPYPFLRDNELSVHGGYAAGFGDTFAGAKASIDYGYKLDAGLWLDIGAGLLSGQCRPRAKDGPCARKGDAAEVLAGVKWKLRMNVPVVPYAKLVAGLAYLYPNGERSALGPLLRTGVGAHYFFYEWLGMGMELTMALGSAGYDDGVALSHTLAGIDVTAGAELAF